MKIADIGIRKIFDSRAMPTLEVWIKNENNRSFNAQIPHGKTRGEGEAVVFDIEKAGEVMNGILKNKLINRDFRTLRELDEFLINIDGTNNKRALGGNLMLGISTAFLRALADEKNAEVWRFLNKEFFNSETSPVKPRIFANLINGGKHAHNNLNVQEYLAILDIVGDVQNAVEKLVNLYNKLGIEIRKHADVNTDSPIGDEGGYSVNLKDDEEGIKLLEKIILKNDLDGEISIGIDASASNFYDPISKKYVLRDKEYPSEKLSKLYDRYFDNTKLLSAIEDPFAENDESSFALLMTQRPDKLLIGDDLTVTNCSRIKKAVENKLINGVVIKPNQIGTISETCDAIDLAKKNGLKIIISHRSGETEDNVIIHLAKASGAYGIKIGSPVRERMYKYNELIRVYDETDQGL